MTYVLKLGGGAGVEHRHAMQNLAARVQQGERWVLVHGTSHAANEMAAQMGYTVETITSPGGHTSRYTDARMIEIYSAAAASINQCLAAELASYGVRSVGLAGPNVITAQRKTAIRAIRNGRPVVIRDDYSGAITNVDTKLLTLLLDAGITPVVAPVAIGQEFERLNVDGDLVAATIARALGAEALIILSNIPGLLRNLDDLTSLIREFGVNELATYEPLAEGRMKKKLLAAKQADMSRVILADARIEQPIDAALLGGGTHIVREVSYADHA